MVWMEVSGVVSVEDLSSFLPLSVVVVRGGRFVYKRGDEREAGGTHPTTTETDTNTFNIRLFLPL